MTTPHEQFELNVSGYALNALDEQEHRTFEAHLKTCARCRADLAELRRVTTGLGMAVDEIAPPPELRAKTLSRATAAPQALIESRRFVERAPASGRRASDRDRRAPIVPAGRFAWWLAAAASIVAIVSLGYGWSMRGDLKDARAIAGDASARAFELARQLDSARRDAANLVRIVQVLSAPDLVKVDLHGQASAPSALGHALLSASRGLVFSARDLPPLTSDRAYQLWVIAGGKPLSVGMIPAATNGVATLSDTITADVSTVTAVAVTAEPAAGSQTPTMPILLMGQVTK